MWIRQADADAGSPLVSNSLNVPLHGWHDAGAGGWGVYLEMLILYFIICLALKRMGDKTIWNKANSGRMEDRFRNVDKGCSLVSNSLNVPLYGMMLVE